MATCLIVSIVKCSDVVLETAVFVSRRPETKKVLVLGRDLEYLLLVLVLIKKVLYTSLVKCQLTNSVPSLLQRISICMCTLHKHIASVFHSWKRDLMYRPTDFLWKLLTWGSCSRSRFVTMTATCRQTGSWIALRCMIQMLLSRPCFTANAGWPRRKTTESWRGLSTLRFGPHFPAITLQEL